MIGRRTSPNYSLAPDALKQIEAKMRQMQATGQVITAEMMEAMYAAALKTGTEQNKLQSPERNNDRYPRGSGNKTAGRCGERGQERGAWPKG